MDVSLERKIEELERRLDAANEELLAFHYAASTLLSAPFTEAQTLFDTLLGLGISLIRAAQGAVYLRETPEELTLKAFRGTEPPTRLTRSGSGLIEHMLRSRAVVFCPTRQALRADLTLMPELSTWLADSFCVLPLIVGDEVAGLLILAGKAQGGALTEEDMQFVTAYSGLAASAVQNAKLMDDLRVRERLAREMEIARRIQSSLLPVPTGILGYEIAARMVTAEQVGGDFYDAHKCDDGFWLAVGDVSSHGLVPGLIMMMAQSILSAIIVSGEHRTPGPVLSTLNRVLFDNIRGRLHEDEYMTLVVGRCFRDGQFVHAGAHLDILVWRKKAGLVENHVTRGPWMGLKANVAPQVVETELWLGAGDIMVLYTDGITEAHRADGLMFDIERLNQVIAAAADGGLTAEAICTCVLDAVNDWAQETEDDRTVVVVKYLG